MATKSYAKRMVETRLLIDGLKDMKDDLPVSIHPNTADNIETLRTLVETLNSEQESMKAQLKKKTEELKDVMENLDKVSGDTKKRIKLDVPQSLWKKFGIEDKK